MAEPILAVLLFGPARESRELRLFRRKEVESVALALGETVCFVGGGADLRAGTPGRTCCCELLCFEFSCCAAASRIVSRCALVEEALLALGTGPLTTLLDGVLPLSLNVKARGGSPAEARELAKILFDHRMRAMHLASATRKCHCAVYIPANTSCDRCVLGAHGLLGLSLFTPTVPTGVKQAQGPAALSRRASQLTANLAMVTANSTVLDPFCGHGSLLSAAANVPCAQTIGCDIDPYALAAAQALLAASGRAELCVADVTRPAFRPAHIADAVISDLPYGMRCEQVCAPQGIGSALLEKYAPHLGETFLLLLRLTLCVLHLARSFCRPTARVVLWLPQPVEPRERAHLAAALEAAAASTGRTVLDLIEELRSGRIKRAVCILGPSAPNAPIGPEQSRAAQAPVPAWPVVLDGQCNVVNVEEGLRALCMRLALSGFLVEAAPPTAAQTQIAASRSRARISRRVETSGDDVSADGVGTEMDFWRSSWAGDGLSVRRMLDGGFDPNALDPLSGCTALLYAAGYGRTEVVQLLLEHHARVDASCSSLGERALMRAARCGHIGAVQALLAHDADVLQSDIRSNTCLHHAAGHGHAHVLRVLLRSHPGARLLRNGSGDMALHCAVRWGHAAAVKELLDAGVGRGPAWREEGADELRPLGLAAKWGHLDVLTLLADHLQVEAAPEGVLTECARLEISEAIHLSMHWKRTAAHAFLCGLLEEQGCTSRIATQFAPGVGARSTMEESKVMRR